jgi:hypothetical protein
MVATAQSSQDCRFDADDIPEDQKGPTDRNEKHEKSEFTMR